MFRFIQYGWIPVVFGGAIHACGTYTGDSRLDKDASSDAAAPNDATDDRADSASIDAATEGGLSCAALGPYKACSDFEPTDPNTRWSVESDPANGGVKESLVFPGAQSSGALRYSRSTVNSGYGWRVSSQQGPASVLDFDILVQEAPAAGLPSGNIALIVANAGLPAASLSFKGRAADGQLEWFAVLRYLEEGGTASRTIALGSAFPPDVWRHVKLRATATWDHVYVALGDQAESDLGAAGTPLTTPSNVDVYVGIGLLSRSGQPTAFKIDNLIIR
jgi:hypothetical protein